MGQKRKRNDTSTNTMKEKEVDTDRPVNEEYRIEPNHSQDHSRAGILRCRTRRKSSTNSFSTRCLTICQCQALQISTHPHTSLIITIAALTIVTPCPTMPLHSWLFNP